MARLNTCAALLTALLVGNCSPASGSEFIYRLSPTPPKAESLSRFTLSPDGKKILFWGRRSDAAAGVPAVDAYGMTMASIACLQSASSLNGCWLQRYETREPPSSVYWQADGAAFYMLTSASNVARVPIGKDAIQYAAVEAKFGRNADRVQITAVTNSSDALGEAKRVKDVFSGLPSHGGYWIKALEACRGQPIGLLADRKTSRLSVVSRGSIRPLPFYDGWAVPASAHRTTDSHLVLELGGRLFKDVPTTETSAEAGGQAAAAGWTTAIDADDGCAVGRYSEREIQRLDGSTVVSLPQMIGGRSASSIIYWSPGAGGESLALVRTDHGDVGVAGFSSDGLMAWLTILPAEGRRAPVPELLNLGSEARVLPARLYRTPDSQKLVIAFHGGPTGTAAWGHSDSLTLSFLQAGADVLLVDGSGSAGYGPALAARIAREGPTAVDEDGEQILMWLKRRRADYPHGVGIYGESFGAMGALALGRSIIRGCPSAEVALALVAPWLVARDPVSLDGEPGLQRVNRGYQRLRDERVLGLDYSRPTDPFRVWQAGLIGGNRWPRVLAIGAEADVVAPPADARALPGAVVEVVPDASHLDVFSTGSVAARVTGHLLGGATSPGCDT